jgi:hypothetical protein
MLITARSSQDFAFCARDREGALEIRFGSCRVRLGRHQRDLAGGSVDLRFTPVFLCRFDYCHRFSNAAPGIIELVEPRVGDRQIQEIPSRVLIPSTAAR